MNYLIIGCYPVPGGRGQHIRLLQVERNRHVQGNDISTRRLLDLSIQDLSRGFFCSAPPQGII